MKSIRPAHHAAHSLLMGPVAFVGLMIPSLAAAQTEAPPAPPTTAADAGAPQATDVRPGQGGLEEIVVTARKRLESAQNVPVAITAISAEKIQHYDLTSLEKVAASTPQFNIGRASNGSGAQITLRGIGSQATSIGLEQSTAIVVDGVYYGQGRIIDEAFLDLSRIELLKGPQALFFGKNATAGVVNIVTADPTDHFQAMGRVGYEFNARQLFTEGYVSGPITPNLSFRLTGRFSDMYGDLYNNHAQPQPIDTTDIATGVVTHRIQQPSKGPFPGTNEKVVRGTLKWEPLDRLTATLKGSFDRSFDQSNAGNYVPFRCAKADGTTQTNPNVRCIKDFIIRQPDAPTGYGDGIPGLRSNGQPYDLYKSASVTGTLVYRLDTMTITSVTNYNWNRNQWGLGYNIESPVSFTASHEDTSWRAFSNENRVQTTFDGPINLMIGTYYQHTKRNYEQDGAFVPLTDSSAPVENQFETYDKLSASKGETLSAFGQVTWKVLPKIEVAAGVRYTHETKDSFLRQVYVNAALQSLFVLYNPNDPTTNVTANQKFNNWSPEVTITYKPTSDITVYGAYKTAYKSGGFSNSAFVIAGAPASNVAFQPEKAHGFEGGIKTTLFDNQLRFNVDAYTYKYTNLQVDFFDSITFQFITTNAGSATTKGVEAEFEYAPRAVPGLNLHGSLNYNRARYKNYLAPCYGGQSIAAGCDTYFIPAGSSFTPVPGSPFTGQDLSGHPTAIAPKWTASLGFNYEKSIGHGLRLGLSSDGRYSSSYLGSSFGEPLSRQKKYASLDATLRLATENDHWELAVIGRNLSNNFHISGVLDAPNSGSGTGTNVALPADMLGLADLPRTVRLQLTVRY